MTRFLNGEEIAALLSGATYVPKQIEANSVHLTAGNIFRQTSVGSVDFGGSEYSNAQMEQVLPVKRSPDDKYGWWDLEQGTYLLELNESVALPDDTIGFLMPSPRITHSGASHAVQLLVGDSERIIVPLSVPSIGIRIKQNARVSQLVVLSP